MAWLAFFLVVFALQLFFWGFFLRVGYRSVSVLPNHEAPGCGEAPVSVIVCFHDEAQVLEQCLGRILTQRYPGDWELLAVDDNSTDGSAAIVQRLAETEPRLRYLHPGPTRPGKKDALTYGIRQARHDFLLLTDADCVPASDKWLYLMAEALREGAEVALGVSMYARSTMSLLDFFQNYEARYVSLKYLGFAERGLPYMGVGRNLAYRKSFFHRAGGLEAHADLPGGDDDLIISNHALPQATVCVAHPAAHTFSRPSLSWGAYLRQRRRHQSVGFRYRPLHAILLGLLGLSHGLFYLLGLILLFSVWWRWAVAAYVLRFGMVYFVQRTTMPPSRQMPTLAQQLTLTLLTGLTLMVMDALLAVGYGYLAVVSCLPARRW